MDNEPKSERPPTAARPEARRTPGRESARARLARLEALARLTHPVHASLDLDQVLAETSRAAAALLELPVAAFWLADSHRGVLTLGGIAAEDGLQFPALEIPMGQGLPGWVATHRTRLVVPDVFAEERTSELGWYRQYGFRSFLGVPIVFEGQLLAVMAMVARQPLRPDALDEETLQGFVGAASAAIRNAQLYRESEARRAELQALVQVTQRLSRGLELRQVLDGIVTAAAQVLGGEAGFRLLEGGDLVRVAETPGVRAAMGRERVRLGESISGRVAQSEKPRLVADGTGEPDLYPEHRAALHEGIAALLVVPVRLGDLTLGTLHVFRPRSRPFDEEALRVGLTLADQAGIAIGNARLFEEAKRRREEAEGLARVARLLAESLEVDTVAARIVESVASLLRVPMAVLRLAHPDGSLRRLATVGFPDELFAPGAGLAEGKGVVGRAVAEGRAVWCRDVQADPSYDLPPDVVRLNAEVGIRAVLALPLRVRGRICGALSVADHVARTFSLAELSLLQAFADQSAFALDNARLYAEAEHGRHEAEALAALARDISASLDPDTVLQRVVNHARELCRADLAHLALREPGSESVMVEFRIGTGQRHGDRRPFRVEPGRGVGGQVLLTGRPFRTDDYARDPRITKDYLGAVEAESVLASLAAPIRISGRVEGLLFVDSRSGAFTDRDEAILVQLAEQAAVAIQNARLFVGERAARAAAEASEAQYRTLFEGVPVGLFRSTSGGRFLDVNPTFVAMMGYPDRESLLATPILDLYVDPEDRQRWKAAVEASGVTRDFEFRVQRRDGGIAWVRTLSHAIRDAEGRIVHYEGAVEDVTIQRRAEAARRESEERFRSVFEDAATGMAIRAASGRHLRVNDALCRMLGYSARELLDLTSADVTPPEARGAEAERDAALLAGRMTAYQAETRYLRKDGSAIWVHLSVSLLRGAPDATTFVVQVQDISERRTAEAGRLQLEAQLRQAQKMEAVGQLAGGVAHDFNNLLAVIMGHSDLMLSVIDARDPLHHDAEAIRQASERAASLTHQLLAFSRRQLLQPQVIDLNALVDKMAGMLRRLIGEPIGLDTELGRGLGRVSADPGQIEQVVMNLALNARDAMPEGGRLLLATSNTVLDREFIERHPGAVAGPQVMLTVGDTGVGMSAEIQAHIFEPFFTTKGPGKGTGLGLSTVYGIVKQHRGYVAVQSAPGQGTTFRIYLPRVDAEVAPSPAGLGRATSPGGSETVLLVEDEAAVRGLLRRLLVQQGYDVLEAHDGPAAIEVAGRHADRIHLLVTDVVMPRMRGRELAERLRDVRPGLRVLFVSGYTDDALGTAALPPGTAFLTKPFAPDALLREVRTLLDLDAP